MIDVHKNRMIGRYCVLKNMLSRFDGIPERDRRTDGQNCYINIARQCADAR